MDFSAIFLIIVNKRFSHDNNLILNMLNTNLIINYKNKKYLL